MPKKIPNSAKTGLDKTIVATQMPALVAALTLLTASLRVTDAPQADDAGASVGSHDTLTKPEVVARNNKATSARSNSSRVKFTTTTKAKIETYSTYQRHPQTNQHKIAAPTANHPRSR
jgi:hypothetical protein